MCSWISDTLRHVAADLSAYQHGEGIPLDVLESFLVSLERVYRELLVKDCINGLTSGERDACELIRHSITELMSLHEVQSREPGSSCTTDCAQEQGVGRPRFSIGRERLTMLIEHRFSVPQVAEMFGVSISTVRRRMTEYGLSISATYSSISDEELDALVKDIQIMFPMCGNRQMLGQLLARGVRVQQHRVRESQRRIDPEGSMLRRLN